MTEGPPALSTARRRLRHVKMYNAVMQKTLQTIVQNNKSETPPYDDDAKNDIQDLITLASQIEKMKRLLDQLTTTKRRTVPTMDESRTEKAPQTSIHAHDPNHARDAIGRRNALLQQACDDLNLETSRNARKLDALRHELSGLREQLVLTRQQLASERPSKLDGRRWVNY